MLRRLIVRAAWPDARYGSRSARARARVIAPVSRATESRRDGSLSRSRGFGLCPRALCEPCTSQAIPFPRRGGRRFRSASGTGDSAAVNGGGNFREEIRREIEGEMGGGV